MSCVLDSPGAPNLAKFGARRARERARAQGGHKQSGPGNSAGWASGRRRRAGYGMTTAGPGGWVNRPPPIAMWGSPSMSLVRSIWSRFGAGYPARARWVHLGAVAGPFKGEMGPPVRPRKAGYAECRGGPAGPANPAPPTAIRDAPSTGPLPLTTEPSWCLFSRPGPTGPFAPGNRATYARGAPTGQPRKGGYGTNQGRPGRIGQPGTPARKLGRPEYKPYSAH